MNISDLPNVSKQEIFDFVVAHLRNQKVKSEQWDENKRDDVCVYRGPNGTMCAAGCLISDDEYHPDFESKSATYVVSRIFATKWLELTPDICYKAHFLRELQTIHDSGEPRDWEAMFRDAAHHEGLEYTAP